MGYALVIDSDIKGRHEKWFEAKSEAVSAWEKARDSGRNHSATLWDTTHSCVKIADYDRGHGEQATGLCRNVRQT